MTDAPKTFSEQEHLAILNDRVNAATETLTAERDEAVQKRDQLASDLDVANAKVESEKARADQAVQDLEQFKTETAEREAAAARKEDRIGKLREAASYMPNVDEFVADEKRVQRVVAMDEEAFDGYVGDLKAAAPPVKAGERAHLTSVPTKRETAMAGEGATPPETTGAGRSFFMGATAGGES
jgi:hypothetical protein